MDKAFSGSCSWFQGRRKLSVGSSADTLAASNRRTVGLSGEAGFEGAGTPTAMGCWGAWRLSDWRSIGQTIVHGSVQVERHVSKSCEGSTGDTVEWCGEAECRASANGQRDATGERSVSLAKFAGITPHNLRSTLAIYAWRLFE